MSLRSMTGFGLAEAGTASGTFRIEIRGVNNRFLEVQTRVPRFLSNLEHRIRQGVSAAIARGSLTVQVSCERDQGGGERLVWDGEAAQRYAAVLRDIVSTCNLSGGVTLADLNAAGCPVVSVESDQVDEERLWSDLEPVLVSALQDYALSRQKEGDLIARDLRAMLDQIAQAVVLVRNRAPVRIENYRRDLSLRIESMVSREVVDPQRLAMEVALMADKRDIEEECSRLEAHIQRFSECFDAVEPVGKRLNFLLQEMNREANTIGSKANDTEIAHLSVELKEYIEKIREQIQNIE